MHGGLHAAQLVFVVLLLFVIAFAALARTLRVPYPIVLVVAGLLVSFVPGLPRVTLEPELIFFVVLPPLLYSAAWQTSWRDFSYNLVSISSLAIGLVAFTVTGVALLGSFLVPSLDRRTGFVLGAVVATTDAIAATAIARRMALPRRIVDVVEGESLVNDATGLLALEFAVSMIVSGSAPTAVDAVLRFVHLVAGGIGVGLLLAVVVQKIETLIDDGPIEIAISILVPYGAYLIAEAIRGSGVLAVVAAGLYLSRRSSRFFSPAVRIQVYSVWKALTFVLNGMVFVLIGLQLPFVRAGIRDASVRTLVLSGVTISALVIVLRLGWVFPGAALSYFIRRRLLGQREPLPPARQLLIVGWTGMRGVIALAAALALPQTTANGAPFPLRNLIIFITFCVILATLVVQGLTLPPLIRALGLAGSAGPACEEREARRLVLKSALDFLDGSPREAGLREVYEDLEVHYRQRMEELVGDARSTAAVNGGAGHRRLFRELSRKLAQVERGTAIRLRDEGRIDDDVLRQIEYELDLTEAGLEGGRGAASTPS